MTDNDEAVKRLRNELTLLLAEISTKVDGLILAQRIAFAAAVKRIGPGAADAIIADLQAESRRVGTSKMTAVSRELEEIARAIEQGSSYRG